MTSWIRIRIQQLKLMRIRIQQLKLIRIRIHNPVTITALTLFSSMAGTSSNMNWSEIPGRKGTNGQIISEIIVLSLANNNNE